MIDEKNEAEKAAVPYEIEEINTPYPSGDGSAPAPGEGSGHPGVIRAISSSDDDESREKKQGRIFSALFDWIELFVVSLAIVVSVMTFLVRHSPVVGSSMEPTVHGKPTAMTDTAGVQGDVMLISNLLYTPRQGDIVVINSPHNFKEPIIKRIIAVGGDTVEFYFDEWKTLVNGKELDEPYLYTSYPENGEEKNPNIADRAGHPMACGALDQDGDGYEKIEVPAGTVFVMGDHRNNSKDSRSLGCIDQRYILGKVLLRIYPFDKFGTLQ